MSRKTSPDARNFSLEDLDRTLESLGKKAPPEKPVSLAGIIRMRLDQIERALSEGVTTREIAEGLGIKRSALALYIRRARNNRAGLNQGGKPRGRNGPRPYTPPDGYSNVSQAARQARQAAESNRATGVTASTPAGSSTPQASPVRAPDRQTNGDQTVKLSKDGTPMIRDNRYRGPVEPAPRPTAQPENRPPRHHVGESARAFYEEQRRQNGGPVRNDDVPKS